jgi:hypothetical protein
MFNTVNYLMYEKRKDLIDPELFCEFNPFLTCKTLSFYNKGEYCDYVNKTLNVFSNIFPTVEMEFRFYENIIIPLKKKRYDYIKKPKKDLKNEELSICDDFFSKRELAIYNNMSKYLNE